MVEYDGYDINEYYFEYPVNAAGYLTMCVTFLRIVLTVRIADTA